MNIVRLNPFEKARLRPTMYIGSINNRKKSVWIYDDEQNLVVMKEMTYNSGLFNIVREIMSNAIDNVWRSQTKTPDTPVRMIKITADLETGEITVWNDGMCFDIEKQESEYKSHRTGKVVVEEMYPAEVCFGEMDSGSNYDDSETRKTSGTNGVGAKLTNIFSTQFKIECSNPKERRKFEMMFTDGASERTKPKVTSFSNKYGYTKISFIPDYEYFKYPNSKNSKMDKNFYSVLKLYAYEIAMITKVLVKFNGENIRINKMEKYVRMFYPSVAKNKLVSFIAPNNDECVVIETDNEAESSKEVQHFSFVNGIQTKNGGIHVDKWSQIIISAFNKSFNTSRKSKKLVSRPEFIRPHLLFFIRTEVDKPMFENQIKDELVKIHHEEDDEGKYTLFEKDDKAGRTEWNTLRDANIKKMMRWGFVSKLEEVLALRVERTQEKSQGPRKRKVYGEGISDAHEAGGPNSHKCTGDITEGISAKTFADGGAASQPFGQKYIGTFAIRGKFKNHRKCSTANFLANAEVQKLKEFFNLREGVDYSDDKNFATLRYGKARIIADNDDDGLHIRILLMNFFKRYKGLFERGYVESMSTAVIEVYFKGTKLERKLFFTVLEYETWIETSEGQKLQPKIKEVVYNKGLGSLEPRDAKMYYGKERKIIEYIPSGQDEDYLQLCLGDASKDRGLMQKRKDWITKSMNNALTEMSEFSEESVSEDNDVFIYQGKMMVKAFIDKQVVIYYRMDLNRMLPCIWDGKKSSGRKIFYSIRHEAEQHKTLYKSPQNLEQLGGSVKKIAGYHHGQNSLYDTMIKMGQQFTGSNNISLLKTRGNFGTRRHGGKNSAAARYISATLNDISYSIFSEKDEPLLDISYADNKPEEYKFFMPIIPMLLVNGPNGCVAGGYKSDIYSYNPDDLVRWIRGWVDDPESVSSFEPLKPWYRGYKGEIEMVKEGDVYTKWISHGVFEKCRGKKCNTILSGGVECKGCQKGKNWFHIIEIPIGEKIELCREWLEYMETGKPTDKIDPRTGKKVAKRAWKTIKPQIRKFEDFSGPDTVNFMIQLDADKTPNDINIGKVLKKQYYLTNMWVIDENDFPHRFTAVEDIMVYFCEKRLRYYNLRKKYMLNILKTEIRKSSNRYRFVKAVGVDKTLDLYCGTKELLEKMEAEPFKFRKILNEKTKKEDYEYLLSLQMRSMTKVKLNELRREFKKYKSEFDALRKKTSGDLWNDDLDVFEEEYEKYLSGIFEELDC